MLVRVRLGNKTKLQREHQRLLPLAMMSRYEEVVTLVKEVATLMKEVDAAGEAVS